jgi:hypothetical protein
MPSRTFSVFVVEIYSPVDEWGATTVAFTNLWKMKKMKFLVTIFSRPFTVFQPLQQGRSLNNPFITQA